MGTMRSKVLVNALVVHAVISNGTIAGFAVNLFGLWALIVVIPWAIISGTCIGLLRTLTSESQ